jgi:hypothetical protein
LLLCLVTMNQNPSVEGGILSICSASEGATPELKNFPNMLYMVRIVVLISVIIRRSNVGKGLFQSQKWAAFMYHFTYLGFEWILAKLVT